MKFLCDQMLGSLARWLRLFGFDTFYANSEINDDEVLKIAETENRVLITRDKELIIRAKKKKIQLIETSLVDLDEQLKQVIKNGDIDEKMILTRCSLCNTILDEIKKKDVKTKVPEKVYKNNDRFWFCSKCDKIYWMGSHYTKIQSKINKIKKHDFQVKSF